MENSAVPEVLAKDAYFLLRRAARLISETIDSTLEPLKLTIRELNILKLISSEPDSSHTQQSLGRRFNIDRSTVMQLIDSLEKRELVQRITDPKDKRSNLIHMTTRGRKTLNRADKAVQGVQAEFLSGVPEADWKLVEATLQTLIRQKLKSNSK